MKKAKYATIKCREANTAQDTEEHVGEIYLNGLIYLNSLFLELKHPQCTIGVGPNHLVTVQNE